MGSYAHNIDIGRNACSAKDINVGLKFKVLHNLASDKV